MGQNKRAFRNCLGYNTIQRHPQSHHARSKLLRKRIREAFEETWYLCTKLVLCPNDKNSACRQPDENL